MTVQIIRTDGTEETHDLPRANIFTQIEKLIGAAATDGINLRDGRSMVVDDLGYQAKAVDHGGGRFELVPTQAMKPVNTKATALYHAVCTPGTTHQIVGDVAIINDSDF